MRGIVEDRYPGRDGLEQSHGDVWRCWETKSGLDIAPCSVSAEVMARVVSGEVDGAVLPIENSLHGSVAEHYDLLLELACRIERESLMQIRHNLIAMPGCYS